MKAQIMVDGFVTHDKNGQLVKYPETFEFEEGDTAILESKFVRVIVDADEKDSLETKIAKKTAQIDALKTELVALEVAFKEEKVKQEAETKANEEKAKKDAEKAKQEAKK